MYVHYVGSGESTWGGGGMPKYVIQGHSHISTASNPEKVPYPPLRGTLYSWLASEEEPTLPRVVK